ncbi:MAG: polynucleotide adenylyltransferase PcnB [Kiritimatiellia bacterium]
MMTKAKQAQLSLSSKPLRVSFNFLAQALLAVQEVELLVFCGGMHADSTHFDSQTHRFPIVLPPEKHGISAPDIDSEALKVIHRLNRHGHVAYLVGGGVRDLLLGRRPKDFDVGTDAHPGTIRKLFPNSYLVGRRFRLVHIRFGNKTIETSTFRRDPDETTGNKGHPIEYRRDDNTFGTPEQDARRRDFTINGLFYDVRSASVLDYVGGLTDLQKRLIRCIGDPDVRFREDPVRMLRAVRFAARLVFQIEPLTYAAIIKYHSQVREVPPARLLEELYRLFCDSSGQKALRLLRETQLLADLLPEVVMYLERHEHSDSHLGNLLGALGSGRYFIRQPTLPLILGTLLWPLFREEIEFQQENVRYLDPHRVATGLLAPLRERFTLPKKVGHKVFGILCLQHRLENPPSRRQRKRQGLRSQDFFLEALSLREIIYRAEGLPDGPLRHWRHLAYTLRHPLPGHALPRP